ADVRRLAVLDSDKIACVTQTTLSPEELTPIVAALEARFPRLSRPSVADICYATSNRQAAVRWLARNVDLVLVIGDPTSSNSSRLRDVAAATGTPAHLISELADLHDEWLSHPEIVGVTAGASTPEDVVEDVVDHLRKGGALVEEEVLVDECISFRLPRDVDPFPVRHKGQGSPRSRRTTDTPLEAGPPSATLEA
ncbi:MAG TPA: hypothetical protein VK867_02920, partial [Candidatus Limnocylindrales bacterium]|nr:hypothetical protein [Candidatus Limnocylindrales bacterium]